MSGGWPYTTQTWRRLRRQKLAETPMCEHCRPRIVPATQVDHIVPISEGGPPFPNLDGLRSLCASCHSRVTARWQRGSREIDPETGKRVGGEDWW
jgi:5-methylcytosine-specific restriction protein A